MNGIHVGNGDEHPYHTQKKKIKLIAIFNSKISRKLNLQFITPTAPLTSRIISPLKLIKYQPNRVPQQNFQDLTYSLKSVTSTFYFQRYPPLFSRFWRISKHNEKSRVSLAQGLDGFFVFVCLFVLFICLSFSIFF